MLYKAAVRLRKSPVGRGASALGKRARQLVRGGSIGSLGDGPNHWAITRHAPGKSLVDVGCMWGIHGAYCFLAEDVGASRVVGVDVYPTTEEFEAERARRSSRVEFVHGDIHARETVEAVGPVDVVFCSGVLYHTPDPFRQLRQLRALGGETLILTTCTIPELPGLRNMAVYWPFLGGAQRRLWNLGRGEQLAITSPYAPEQGYGNWFWGMTPSCLESVIRTAGFEIEEAHHASFISTVIARRGPENFQSTSGDWFDPS